MKGHALFKGEMINMKSLDVKFKTFLNGPISTKFLTKYTWVKGIKVWSNVGPLSSEWR